MERETHEIDGVDTAPAPATVLAFSRLTDVLYAVI